MSSLITEIMAPCFMFMDTNQAPIEIKTKHVLVTAGATNVQVVAAVTGKRLRILSVVAEHPTTASELALKDGSGGANLLLLAIAAGAANQILPPNSLGWCDTSAGVGLYADAGAGANVNVSVRYIEYTQVT